MEDGRDRLLAVARRMRHRLRAARAIRAGAMGLIAGAGCAMAIQAAAMIGWLSVKAAWQVGGAVVNTGLAIGLVVGIMRPRSLGEAAAFVDTGRHLRERFATAVELIVAGRDRAPAAEVCIRQATDSLGRRPLAGVDVFSGTRRPLAAAALMTVLLLAGAVLAWDVAGPLAKFSPDQRTALADAFRESSSAVGAEELQQALSRAAVAVRRVDDDELAAVLAELRRQGFRPVELTPEAVRAAKALMADAATDGPGLSDGTPPPEPDNEDTIGPWLRVYDPSHSSGETAEADVAAPPTDGNYEESWQAAQRRATAALDRGDIPFTYRQLIRNYFRD